MNLGEREYHCERCHWAIDRDLNAAVNLARWAPGVAVNYSLYQEMPKLFVDEVLVV